jgi:hypothetical protein
MAQNTHGQKDRRADMTIKRPRRVGVRVNEDEIKNICDQANVIVPMSDMRILAELRRLGGLLKLIHLETRGACSRDTANAIKALESYARSMEEKLGSGGHDSRNSGEA